MRVGLPGMEGRRAGAAGPHRPGVHATPYEQTRDRGARQRSPLPTGCIRYPGTGLSSRCAAPTTAARTAGGTAMSWVPDSCTLPTDQAPLRVAEFNDLFTTALHRLQRPEPRWLRLGLDPAPQVEATAPDLAARETACCSFFDFRLQRDHDGQLWLDVRVPAGREPILDAIARQATAHAPQVAG